MLLITGFGVSFLLLWCLLTGSLAAISNQGVSKPVLNVGGGFAETNTAAQKLPLQVLGTSLMAEQIVLYEGPLPENGQSDGIGSTAALLLRNTGEQGVEQAEVILETGDRQLVFEADMIPPGEAVLVPEKSRCTFGPQVFTACYGTSVPSTENWECWDMLQISSVDIGTVAVSNQTEKILCGIMLYYKDYFTDPGFFVGEQSYIYLIEFLEPGQTIFINPVFYAEGYSRIARIKIDKSL